MLQNLKDYKIVRGYDVVSYFDGKPKIGNFNTNTTYQGGVYQFSSEENRKKFLENPEKYRPAYGGFCAIAMTEGSTVDSNPESYIIQDGRLLMFFATKFLGSFIIDTRRQWRKDPKNFLTLADKVYTELSK